ncbi:hypothetical protein L6452_01207 [Arctium lappa]|uniref:Uncharacterized protein n=1 Tax=Arctium lappa TaxID=4217 RepID=A0ACB9FGX0_ARCLA|nr:hypothetical protein L6452_01207 [Arctium lappa]
MGSEKQLKEVVAEIRQFTMKILKQRHNLGGVGMVFLVIFKESGDRDRDCEIKEKSDSPIYNEGKDMIVDKIVSINVEIDYKDATGVEIDGKGVGIPKHRRQRCCQCGDRR